MSLEKRWYDFWMLIPSASRNAVLDERARVWKRYQEPHRAYHTLEHIEFCLAQFDEVHSLAANPWVVEAGIYFHDVIYDARRQDNESRSARWAGEVIARMSGSGYFIDAVRSVIRATRHRETIPDKRRDEQLICDTDLAGLGLPWKEFEKASERIRQEHSWLSNSEWRRIRIMRLQVFLDRKHIYYLPEFRSKYEEQARENLRRAIVGLRRRSSPGLWHLAGY